MKFVAFGSKLVYLPIVLGGTAASHTCSGVGGGHFFIREVGSQIQNRPAGSNQGAALTLSLFAGALDGAFDGAFDGALDGACIVHAALGIFFRFQITDFDVFCLFLHFVIYPLLACWLFVLCQ
jgi:hypothetical protein